MRAAGPTYTDSATMGGVSASTQPPPFRVLVGGTPRGLVALIGERPDGHGSTGRTHAGVDAGVIAWASWRRFDRPRSRSGSPVACHSSQSVTLRGGRRGWCGRWRRSARGRVIRRRRACEVARRSGRTSAAPGNGREGRWRSSLPLPRLIPCGERLSGQRIDPSAGRNSRRTRLGRAGGRRRRPDSMTTLIVRRVTAPVPPRWIGEVLE